MVMSWDFMVIHGDFIIVFIYQKGSNICKSSWPLGEFSQIMSFCAFFLVEWLLFLVLFWSEKLWHTGWRWRWRRRPRRSDPSWSAPFCGMWPLTKIATTLGLLALLMASQRGVLARFFLEGRVRFKTKKNQLNCWFQLGFAITKALKLVGPVGSVGRSQESFIELQDKLHQNICRRRTLAAGQSMRGLSMLVPTCGPLQWSLQEIFMLIKAQNHQNPTPMSTCPVVTKSTF